MLTTEQKIQALRILRAAKVGEPTSMTSKRRVVFHRLLAQGYVEKVGERRGGLLARLTEHGEDELRVLELQVGRGVVNYSLKASVRRSTGDRGADMNDAPLIIEDDE